MMKKVLPWILFISFFALLIIGFLLKNKMNNYLSEMMQKQTSPEILFSGNALIDSLYNYSENGLNYKISFLEFGSSGCSACKRMESVMEEIHSKYPTRVNIVFLNVLKPESQKLMKLFGIVVIPTQVLLDGTGKEYYRHTGFISTEELARNFTFLQK